ncbi:MAG: hypothetical protein ACFFD7_12905 [Candidatus Thorarchaeota archaeon]
MDNNSNINTEMDALKKRIERLEIDLDKKDAEIYEYLEKIENLEDTIMKLELLIPKEDENKKSKKQKKIESRLVLEIEDRDRQIRDLKNKMGFLRKEKTQLQQQLEDERVKSSNSSVIRIENIRSSPPLETLVSDLQDKVNKYKLLIDQLRKESVDITEFDSELKRKEEAIERRMAYSLQAQVDELTKELGAKKESVEKLKNENENLLRKLEVLEVQNKIKEQKIEELKKKKRKK